MPGSSGPRTEALSQRETETERPAEGKEAASPADPELLALPGPPRAERRLTVVLMGLTALVALVVAHALRGEASYALAPGEPEDLGELASLTPSPRLENRYVRGEGLLGSAGAIRYGRPAEGDSFRLAPVAGNPALWVEIRVPEGFEGPRFVPPTSFAGRLVPLRKAGLRHAWLARTVKDKTGTEVPKEAWLLVDGSSPRSSRWALALAGLFVGFAGWNLLGIVRLLRRLRDWREDDATGRGPESPDKELPEGKAAPALRDASEERVGERIEAPLGAAGRGAA